MAIFNPIPVDSGKGYTFDQIATPTPNAIGDTWLKRNLAGNPELQCFWNGVYWLSQLFQVSVLINGGSAIYSTTGSHPFCPGVTYDFFIEKIITMFYIDGVLSSLNFWRLRFNLGSRLATIFVDSNSNASNYVESEIVLNQKFSNPGISGSNGYHNCSFEIHGNPPPISGAAATFEYRLVVG